MDRAKFEFSSTWEAPMFPKIPAYSLPYEAMDCGNVLTSSDHPSLYSKNGSLMSTHNLNPAVDQYNDENPVAYKVEGVERYISGLGYPPSLPPSFIASSQSIGSQSTTLPFKAGCGPQRIVTGENDEKNDEKELNPNLTYASLIYKALKSAPDKRLCLPEIYAWFKINTDKCKDDLKIKSCQKVIRHCLTYNDGFQTIPIKDTLTKELLAWWYLADEADHNGIQPTGRYRMQNQEKQNVSGLEFAAAEEQHPAFGIIQRKPEMSLEIVPSSNNSPYRYFVYEALNSAPDKRLRLREIYAWFKKNIDKCKDEKFQGWQHGIRYHLKTNGGFKSIQLKDPGAMKLETWWYLMDNSIQPTGHGLEQRKQEETASKFEFTTAQAQEPEPTTQTLEDTTGRSQMPEQTQKSSSCGYIGDSSHNGYLKPHELPGHPPESHFWPSMPQDLGPPFVLYESAIINSTPDPMARPRSDQLSSATLSDVTPICPARSSRLEPLHSQQHLDSPELVASNLSSLEDEMSLCHLTLKNLFEYIRTGRLIEASQSLLKASKWLLTNSQDLGMPGDGHLSYSDLLVLWKKLDLCWLALCQKQQDLIEASLRGGPSAQVSLPRQDELDAMGEVLIQLCDQLEQHRLVDYQRGIWEEETFRVLVQCLQSNTVNPHS